MRTDTRLCVGISGIVVLLGFCGIAQAQTPDSSLPNLSLLIGERIEVTDEDGSVFTGQLIRASEASLVLEVDRKQTELPPRRIRGISRWEEDSVANGILIGTGLGFLIPALISAGIDTGEPGEAAAILIPPGLGIGWPSAGSSMRRATGKSRSSRRRLHASPSRHCWQEAERVSR